MDLKKRGIVRKSYLRFYPRIMYLALLNCDTARRWQQQIFRQIAVKNLYAVELFVTFFRRLLKCDQSACQSKNAKNGLFFFTQKTKSCRVCLMHTKQQNNKIFRGIFYNLQTHQKYRKSCKVKECFLFSETLKYKVGEAQIHIAYFAAMHHLNFCTCKIKLSTETPKSTYRTS